MRLLSVALLSLMLAACGQSGALYFAKPGNAEAEQESAAKTPVQNADKDSTENSDATTGP